MSEGIEKEIIRLVKEIAQDERDLDRAERLDLKDNITRYGNAINRKLEVIRLLRDKA